MHKYEVYKNNVSTVTPSSLYLSLSMTALFSCVPELNG